MVDDIAPVLDLKGLSCPLPLLKMKLALKPMSDGELLAIETTDAGSWKDFHKFSDITQNELVSAELIDDVYYFVIRKGS